MSQGPSYCNSMWVHMCLFINSYNTLPILAINVWCFIRSIFGYLNFRHSCIKSNRCIPVLMYHLMLRCSTYLAILSLMIKMKWMLCFISLSNDLLHSVCHYKSEIFDHQSNPILSTNYGQILLKVLIFYAPILCVNLNIHQNTYEIWHFFKV